MQIVFITFTYNRISEVLEWCEPCTFLIPIKSIDFQFLEYSWKYTITFLVTYQRKFTHSNFMSPKNDPKAINLIVNLWQVKLRNIRFKILIS